MTVPGALALFLVLQRRKDTETNTHRQHVRIVQSHHRILCNNSNCRRSSLLSSSRAASPSLPLCHLTSSVSLVCLTDSKSPSLCPRSLRLPCQSPPHLLLHLLCWPLSLSLSLACLLLYSPSLSASVVSHSLFSLLCFSHSLLAFLLPPAFLFAAVPLPAHLFCLFSSPPLLLSRPESLTPPPPSYFPASVTPANFPLPSASFSCRSPPLLFLSLPLFSFSM